MMADPNKRYVIGWRLPDGREDKGDAYHTIEEARAYCHQLNNEHPHMFHFPIEVIKNASENNKDITVH